MGIEIVFSFSLDAALKMMLWVLSHFDLNPFAEALKLTWKMLFEALNDSDQNPLAVKIDVIS